MTPHLFFAASIALAMASAAPPDQTSPQERRDTPPLVQNDSRLGAGITIIRLKYADAEELPATLAPILPEGVKVVAYPPLNALIITRQPAGLQPPRR